MAIGSKYTRRGRGYPDRRSALALLVLLAALLAGCGSAPQQHARFAQAGTTYAAALDSLLQVAGDVNTDAHSYKLLQERTLAPVSPTRLKELADADRGRLKTISRLRRHARLLADYFGLLNNLATSDAPSRAGDAIGGTAKALGDVGKELRDPTLNSLAADQDKFKVVTGFVVSSLIRGRLNSELGQRKDTIRLELKTQEVLLKALSDDIRQNLQVTADVREDLLVDQPLAAGIPPDKYQEWIADRRSVLVAPETVEELDVASGDVRELREAFEDLIQGRLNRQRLDLVLKDFDALLSVAETLKKSPGGKS